MRLDNKLTIVKDDNTPHNFVRGSKQYKKVLSAYKDFVADSFFTAKITTKGKSKDQFLAQLFSPCGGSITVATLYCSPVAKSFMGHSMVNISFWTNSKPSNKYWDKFVTKINSI